MTHWNITARSDADAAEKTISVSWDKRRDLSTKEREAFVIRATHGLAKKFSFMSRQVGSEDAFKDSYNLSILIERLGEHAREHDILQGFNIFETRIPLKIDGTPDFTKLPDEINLLTAPLKDITIDQVKESVKFKRRYGKENDIEDLDWTMRLLENSSNEDLLEKCIEHKMSIDSLET